jgi:hypothetical protein
MAVNVKIGESKPQNIKPYPKLMESIGGRLVFMINDKIGFQINTAFDDGPHYFTDWHMDDFTDFNEPLTLQNK